MVTPHRLDVFVPYQQAEAAEPFAVRFARRLASAGDRVAVLARREDAAGRALSWGDACLTALPEQDQKPRKGRLPLASREDWQALESGPLAGHDVLFLPQPYRALPAGNVPGCAAPVVVRVASFAHDDAEYGASGDIARRDIAFVLTVAQLVVFPTEELRRHAVARYGVDEAKTRVVPEAVDPPASGREDVRAKYGLPERYLVCENGRDPILRLPELLEGLALLERRGGGRIGLVSLGPNIDPVYNEPWPADELPPEVRAFWYDIPAPADDCHAILSHAVALLARPAGLAGPTTVDLMASAAGLPRLAPSESSPDGFADLLARCDDLPRVAPPSRTLADVVEDYRRLFAEAAGCWLRPSACVHRPAVAPRPRERRVAWLQNHTTLHDCEVPLLRRMGLEVYTAKKVVPATEFRSISTDYTDDAETTLPAWALEILNGHDFYDQPLTPAVTEVLNTYFAAVIASTWPVANYQLLCHYEGRILTRVFGREHPSDYTSLLEGERPGPFWRSFHRHRRRYWLAPSYDEITAHEPTPLRDAALTLPVGIPPYTWRQQDTWRGTDPRVLFVCPYIKSSPYYYGPIYQQFKAAFDGVPHWVAGDQPDAVDDPCVSGYASERVFTSWMRTFRVMYYHSREPRHVHYHPLEAIVFGMPVVFLRGGLLEAFGGPDQPGACDTEAEARDKVERLLRGDDALAAQIRAAQGKILDPFRDDYNERLWRERFLGVVMAAPAHTGERPPSASFAAVVTPAPDLPVEAWSGPVTPVLPPSPARQEVETLRAWIGGTGEPAPEPAGVRRAGPLPFLLDEPEAVPEAAPSIAPPPPEQPGLARRLVDKASDVADCGLVPVLYLRGVVAQSSFLPKETGATRKVPRWVFRLRPFCGLAEWCHRRAVGVSVCAPDEILSPEALVESLLFVAHGLPHDERAYFGEDAPRLAADWQRVAQAGAASVHPSEWSRAEAIRRHGFDPERSYVLPLAPPPAPPVTEEEVRLALGRFGLTRGAYWIHAGNFDPAENLITLFRVLEQQRCRGDRVLPLVLIGHQTQVRQPAGVAAYHDALRSAARRAGLCRGDGLHLLPDLAPRDRAALMAGAAGCLAPGLTSGQVPLPAMEAMGRRVPVLIGRTPGVEGHLGADAGRFLLLPPQEPGAWVRAMHAVTHHAADVEESVRAGFDWASAEQSAFPGRWRRLLAAVGASPSLSRAA